MKPIRSKGSTSGFPTSGGAVRAMGSRRRTWNGAEGDGTMPRDGADKTANGRGAYGFR